MIIALWSWAEHSIYSKLTGPHLANRYVWESRLALLEEITWSPITSPKVSWQFSETAGAMFVGERNECTHERPRLQLSCTVCTVHTEPWTLWEEGEEQTKKLIVNPIASLAAWLVGFVELDLLDLKLRLRSNKLSGCPRISIRAGGRGGGRAAAQRRRGPRQDGSPGREFDSSINSAVISRFSPRRTGRNIPHQPSPVLSVVTNVTIHGRITQVFLWRLSS